MKYVDAETGKPTPLKNQELQAAIDTKKVIKRGVFLARRSKRKWVDAETGEPTQFKDQELQVAIDNKQVISKGTFNGRRAKGALVDAETGKSINLSAQELQVAIEKKQVVSKGVFYDHCYNRVLVDAETGELTQFNGQELQSAIDKKQVIGKRLFNGRRLKGALVDAETGIPLHLNSQKLQETRTQGIAISGSTYSFDLLTEEAIKAGGPEYVITKGAWYTRQDRKKKAILDKNQCIEHNKNSSCLRLLSDNNLVDDGIDDLTGDMFSLDELEALSMRHSFYAGKKSRVSATDQEVQYDNESLVSFINDAFTDDTDIQMPRISSSPQTLFAASREHEQSEEANQFDAGMRRNGS